MSNELIVPDLGNFADILVVEVLVKPGDRIEVDTPLVTLETDKASMDVPASRAGVIAEVLLKRGDKVSKGSIIARLGDAAESGSDSKADSSQHSKADSASSAKADSTSGAKADSTSGAKADSTSGAKADSTSGAKADSTSDSSARSGSDRADSTSARAASTAGVQQNVGQAPGTGTASRSGGPSHLLVLGAGPGGYTAAFRAADLGLKVTLVERWPSLGGVCLNVGCIPSKALLHAAKVIEEAASMSAHGIEFGAPRVDRGRLRDWKASVVKKLTGGLRMLAKQRKVEVVEGSGRFVGPNELEVTGTGEPRRIQFDQCIIAAGSESARLPGLPSDPRVIDSTGALELPEFQGGLLVIGGGIIGLEMACVYDALGARVSVVELTAQLMPGCDPDLVRPLEKRIRARYESVLVGTKVAAVEARADGLHVVFAGDQAPQPLLFDRVLVAVGRVPNGKAIAAEAAGVRIGERGFIPVDKQMRTNVSHIFAIGDIAAPPMLAHKAMHEAKVAAEVAAGHKAAFDARVIPSVAYTDPEIAWVGLTESEAKAKSVAYRKGAFPWAANGRSLSLGRDDGFTKLLFDPESHRLLGAGIVGTNAGDLISEVALAIEMGCDASDVGLTIHPHPTLSETIAAAADAFEGTLTDLYVPKR